MIKTTTFFVVAVAIAMALTVSGLLRGEFIGDLMGASAWMLVGLAGLATFVTACLPTSAFGPSLSTPPKATARDVVGSVFMFLAAGLQWREPGCSMCLAMNPDKLEPGQRCASTSNRNFEGRQGKGGRTHLVSPAMAAAAAIEGHFVDIREWNYKT